jgi:hypothetical protein
MTPPHVLQPLEAGRVHDRTFAAVGLAKVDVGYRCRPNVPSLRFHSTAAGMNTALKSWALMRLGGSSRSQNLSSLPFGQQVLYRIKLIWYVDRKSIFDNFEWN